MALLPQPSLPQEAEAPSFWVLRPKRGLIMNSSPVTPMQSSSKSYFKIPLSTLLQNSPVYCPLPPSMPGLSALAWLLCFQQGSPNRVPSSHSRPRLPAACTVTESLMIWLPPHSPLLISLSSGGGLLFLTTLLLVLPQVLCTCYSCHLTYLPTDIQVVVSIDSLRSQLKCHFLREALFDHPG